MDSRERQVVSWLRRIADRGRIKAARIALSISAGTEAGDLRLEQSRQLVSLLEEVGVVTELAHDIERGRHRVAPPVGQERRRD